MTPLEKTVRRLYADVYAVDYDRAPATVHQFIFEQARNSVPRRPCGPNVWADFTLQEAESAYHTLRAAHGATFATFTAAIMSTATKAAAPNVNGSATVAPTSLFAKLVEISKEMGWIPKDGEFKAGTTRYNFARESDVVDYIRPKCAAHGVFVSSELVEGTVEVKQITYGSNNTLAFMATGYVRIDLIDGESGERFSRMGYGMALDSGDKVVNKLSTAGAKYALIRAFCAATGEDPDGERHEGDQARDSGGEDDEEPPTAAQQSYLFRLRGELRLNNDDVRQMAEHLLNRAVGETELLSKNNMSKLIDHIKGQHYLSYLPALRKARPATPAPVAAPAAREQSDKDKAPIGEPQEKLIAQKFQKLGATEFDIIETCRKVSNGRCLDFKGMDTYTARALWTYLDDHGFVKA